MTVPDVLRERVAEAMCAVGHPGEVAEEMALNGSVWLRLAQAAIDALGLTEEHSQRWITRMTREGAEWEYRKPVSDPADLPPLYGGMRAVSRVVGPWVEEQR